MAITLELNPETEVGLIAQAKAAGLTLSQFLSQTLEAIAPALPERLVPAGAAELLEWEKTFDEWADSFPQHPVLSDEALKRENWYPDRW